MTILITILAIAFPLLALLGLVALVEWLCSRPGVDDGRGN